MLGDRLKVFVCISILLDILNSNIWTNAINPKLTVSSKHKSIKTENLLLQGKNQVYELKNGLNAAVKIPIEIDEEKNERNCGTVEIDAKPIALEATGIENREMSGENLIIKPNVSEFFSSSKNSVYKYDQEISKKKLTLLDHGFYKSTCFLYPNPHNEPDEYCILINTTINNGQGCVIVTPSKYLEGFFKNGLKISDDPSDLRTVDIVQMPEKGGMGAVAACKIQRGDLILQQSPVGLFPYLEKIWKTPFGHSIRRQAIDHLPLKTQEQISFLAGKGQNKDQFISNMIDVNLYDNYHYVSGTEISFGGIYLKVTLMKQLKLINKLQDLSNSVSSLKAQIYLKVKLKSFSRLARRKEYPNSGQWQT
ncbi:hypothetical protein PGTUg99_022724 [Puccinia graminis f. sp. tritici]|uniref:Uncharacterized protein n=1 Tax=Puccinia graminis f. sp. tritici TaxID=56615 RepID=A0A5B0QLF0_PUCGR|nr:hypothetical protein PGTUg99_022724 [Puccinia graminis f. sp. tritici]